jgi:CxxC motif-containing protein (DUF1111 family)
MPYENTRCQNLSGKRTRAAIAAFVMATIALSAGTGSAFDGEEDVQRFYGKAEFERDWIPPASVSLFDGQEPPASPSIWDGLGPLYNETRCSSCHLGPALAGRFVPSGADGLSPIGLVVRLGDGEGKPDPYFGAQIQTRAIEGVMPEAQVRVTMPHGPDEPYELALDLLRGELDAATLHAAIAAPALIGRGEIGRVDPEAIEALAVAQSERDDGIAGKVRRVPTSRGPAVGLFGYKAEHPTLLHQISYSYAVEMGISNALHMSDYGDCTPAQTDCMNAPVGDHARRSGVEITDREIETVVAYLSGLLAPAQTDPDHAINDDFSALGCALCHVPTLPSKDGNPVVLYSDLLLHDLGPDFDNGIGAPGVAPSQWRTAPLLALSPYSGRRYLHDGRAVSVDAAIRAHGGEAMASRRGYEQLDAASRARLIAFLEGL